MSHIVIVEDDGKTRATLDFQLRGAGYDTTAVADAESAAHLLTADPPPPCDLLLLDVRLGAMSGVDLVRDLSTSGRLPTTVIASGEATISETVEALRLGVYDFLEKPFSAERLLRTVHNALTHDRMRRELAATRAADNPILGNSSAIRDLLDQVARAAQTDARVLVCGESGTGKELVANLLHAHSRRADGPLVKVNCAAIPPNLIEAELFGHEAGAFTDAGPARAGLFESADTGTLLLDEIGEMPPTLQARLLRVLEDGQVRRVGATRSRRIDARVIASTNRDIEHEIRRGAFREDLFYRLAQLTLSVPPLRERGEDVRLLFKTFLDQACQRHRVPTKRVDAEVFEALDAYRWPGNVRELRNLCDRLAVFAGDPLRREHLPSSIVEPAAAGGELGLLRFTERAPSLHLRALRQACEREYIEHVLQRTGWNFAAAARILGVQRTYLHHKATALEIQRPAGFRDPSDG